MTDQAGRPPAALQFDGTESAQLTTASGTQTQTFSLSPCGLHNCSGGPHGGAPSI